MNIIESSVIPMIGIAIFLAALVVGDILGTAADKLMEIIKERRTAHAKRTTHYPGRRDLHTQKP